jgi:hypothetical protein
LSDLVKSDPLKMLVDKLVPPREVRVTDLLGNEYTVPSAISARRNIQVVRHLQNVLGEPAVARAVGNLDALLSGGDLGASIFHIVGIVSSEEVIGHVAAAFECAHPDTLALARRNVTPDGAMFDPIADDLPDAADLFSVEELATALVPLFVGLAKRSMQALSVVSGALEA